MAENLESLRARSIDLLEQVQNVETLRQTDGVSFFQISNNASQGAHLNRAATGPHSIYSESLSAALQHKSVHSQYAAVAGVLQAFHTDLAKSHLVNIRHEVKSVVVSEIVTHAQKLLKTSGVHPAAAVLLACAGVEEFL